VATKLESIGLLVSWSLATIGPLGCGIDDREVQRGGAGTSSAGMGTQLTNVPPGDMNVGLPTGGSGAGLSSGGAGPDVKTSLGAPCQGNAECALGNCVDGVCCDSPCTELCAVCNSPDAPGTCTAAPSDPLCPEPTCAGVSSECGPLVDPGLSQNCQALGSCRASMDCSTAPVATGTPCQEGAGTCDGAGACLVPSKTALGGACSLDSECAEAHCVDNGAGGGGICCNAACDGLCEACSDNGQCQAAADDDRCADVPCDSLAVGCKSSTRLTSNLCRAQGICKTTSDCSFSNVPNGTPCGISSSGLVCEEGDCVSPQVTCGVSTCTIDRANICCSRGVEAGALAGYSCENRSSCSESGIEQPVQPVECDSPDDCLPGTVCCLDDSVSARFAKLSCLPTADCNIDDFGQLRFAQICGSLSFSAPGSCPAGRPCIGSGDDSVLPGFAFCGPPP
jgi:hypothetical protein